MVVEDLRTTQMGKKRRLEEKRQYCHELVNMKPRLRDRPCWARRRVTENSAPDYVGLVPTRKI